MNHFFGLQQQNHMAFKAHNTHYLDLYKKVSNPTLKCVAPQAPALMMVLMGNTNMVVFRMYPVLTFRYRYVQFFINSLQTNIKAPW